MFARLFAVASIAALAVAFPARLSLRDQCTTGAVNGCCQSTMPASQASNLFRSSDAGLADILAGVEATVGIGCSAIVGTSANCQQQPVCCENNDFSGLVNIGCSPINVGA